MPKASERWTSRPFAEPTSRPIANARAFLTCPVANPSAITEAAAMHEAVTVFRTNRLLTGMV